MCSNTKILVHESFPLAAVVIGFLNPPVNVTETDGAVLIEVGILSGVLQRNVVINFSTQDLEAVGGKLVSLGV